MSKSIVRIKVALLILGSVAPGLCLADTVYNDLGPGNTWIINREYDVNSDFMATSFVTTGAGNLLDLSIPLFSLNNPVVLGLYTDSNGAPGTLLENWNLTAPGFPGILTTVQSVGNPFLSAGKEYWLVIDVSDAQKDKLAWYQNDLGAPGGIWIGNSLNALIEALPDSPAPAFQLNSATASALPEPAGAVGLGTSIVLMAIFGAIRRRRRLSGTGSTAL